MVGDIIVTAQKRAENVQDVPISIVALSGETLDSTGVRSALDLPRLVPNLQANKGPTTASVRLSVRGLGAYGNSAVEPSAGVFIDGIYIPHPGSVFGTFLDVGSVEVLRGPQGTLFGRNTSVGAISLNSAMPTKDVSGSLAIESGTGERFKAYGDINFPLSDKVSVRIAGLGETFGGYYHNQFDGRRLGGVDTIAFRATVKAELTDTLTLVVRGDYQDRQIDSNAAVIVRNVGKLRQQGFELETTLRPDCRFTVNGAVAFLDSEFLSYQGAPGLPGFGGVQDLTGKSANNSSRWSGTAGVEWRDKLGSDGWSWSLRGDLSFTSAANLGQVTDGNPDTIQPEYALVGGRLSVYGPEEKWSVSVFAQNIGNKGYCALDVYQVFDGPLGLRNATDGSTLVRCIAGAPRAIGASASVRF